MNLVVSTIAVLVLFSVGTGCNTGPANDEDGGPTEQAYRSVRFEYYPAFERENAVAITSVFDPERDTAWVEVVLSNPWSMQNDSEPQPPDSSFLIPLKEHIRLCGLIASISNKDVLRGSWTTLLDGDHWTLSAGGNGSSTVMSVHSPKYHMQDRHLNRFVEAGEAFLVLAGLGADYPERADAEPEE